MTRSLVQYEKGLLPRPLAVLIAFAMGAVPGWAAAVDAGAVALEPVEASFNSAFLVGRTQGVDISRFERGNPVSPGMHQVDLYVNGQWIGSESVIFRAVQSGGAHACFNAQQLERYGIEQRDRKSVV